jgi:FkbM family methyltransferase
MSRGLNGAVRLVRPAKVSSAVRRRWFERRLGHLALAPGPPVVSLGTEYGAWQIPEGWVARDWICYSVGAGADISFDLELVHLGALVRSFDPVPEYGRRALEVAGGEPRFTFTHAAVTAHEGPIEMQVHHQTDTQSLSAAGLYDTNRWVQVPGRTIPSLMREFGDDRIDLLKLDVEGSEYELVPTLDLVALGVRVFAAQFHHAGSVRDAMRLIDGLREQGFRPIARRPVVKLTFVRR